MNPFLPDEVEALRALARTWPNARMVVLGAAALRCFMPMPWRTTEDLDLTVAASVEDATAALSRFPGWSSNPLQEQRWRTPSGIAVDIIPASDEALARGHIEWPRSGFRMSLLGMRLAFEQAITLRIVTDLEVRVAPLHVISVLKMIAYLDRPEARAKDLGDIAHIMHRYIADDSDRRFSVEVPDDLAEYDDVAPYLLGRDVGAVVDSDERRRISDFVGTSAGQARGPGLLARMSILGPPAWRDPDAVLERIRVFSARNGRALTEYRVTWPLRIERVRGRLDLRRPAELAAALRKHIAIPRQAGVSPGATATQLRYFIDFRLPQA